MADLVAEHVAVLPADLALPAKEIMELVVVEHSEHLAVVVLVVLDQEVLTELLAVVAQVHGLISLEQIQHMPVAEAQGAQHQDLAFQEQAVLAVAAQEQVQQTVTAAPQELQTLAVVAVVVRPVVDQQVTVVPGEVELL
jgi:transcriptional regulator of aromatic amino acid metabolism